MKGAKGFTLIELMISVAIIGILASVVYPAYSEYVLKSRRSEAMRLLVEAAAKQEQYYSDFKTYTTNMTELGYSANPYVSDSGYYSISVTTSSSNISSQFTLKATAKSLQTKDTSCKELSFDHVGRKTATSNDCWVN